MSRERTTRPVPRPRLERKIVAGVLLLFAIPAAVVTGALTLLHLRGAFTDAGSLATAGLIAFVAVMAYLAVVSRTIARSLARTLVDLTHGTELMASVHPDYRHDVRTGDELEALAEEINRMADGLRDARLGLDDKVLRATRELSDEHATLAAILEEVDAGIVVARPDGLVTLANRAARDLLGGDLLGRSLFEVVDRETVTHFRDRLQPGGGVAERFTVRGPAGAVFEAGMTSFPGRGEALGGFILTLREAGRPTRWGETELPLGAHSDALLHEPDAQPAVPRLVGAGLLSGTARGAPLPRPQLYDFSVLDRLEQLVPASDRRRALRDLAYVALDVETTGFRPDAGDRIVSLAGVKIRAGLVKRSEYFDALVNPGRPVPAQSARVHGITDAMIAGAPPIEVVLPAFDRFAEGAVLVGHDVWFDLAFLGKDAQRLGIVPPTAARVLDARLLSEIVHGHAGEHTLDAVADRFGVAVQGRHSALGDALTTAEIFVRLLGLLDARGVRTLGDALDAMHAVRNRWSKKDRTRSPS